MKIGQPVWICSCNDFDGHKYRFGEMLFGVICCINKYGHDTLYTVITGPALDREHATEIIVCQERIFAMKDYRDCEILLQKICSNYNLHEDMYA